MNGARLPNGSPRGLNGIKLRLELMRFVSWLLSVCAGPGLEKSAFAFAVFVERQVGEALIGNEFLLAGVFNGQVKIRMPRARVDVQLTLLIGYFTI